MSLAAAILLGATLLAAAVGKMRVSSRLQSATVLGAVILALEPIRQLAWNVLRLCQKDVRR